MLKCRVKRKSYGRRVFRKEGFTETRGSIDPVRGAQNEKTGMTNACQAIAAIVQGSVSFCRPAVVHPERIRFCERQREGVRMGQEQSAPPRELQEEQQGGDCRAEMRHD